VFVDIEAMLQAEPFYLNQVYTRVFLEYVFEKAAGGVPLTSNYPYHPFLPNSPFICWATNKLNFGYIPQKYYKIGDSDLIGLLQQGPVAISVSSHNWEDYRSGVFRCGSGDRVNHAVLLVGYTPDYWIIKNQWGTDWGEKGFIRVTRNPLYNCKVGSSAFIMGDLFLSCVPYLFALCVLFFGW
jgi:hypothetical protein